MERILYQRPREKLRSIGPSELSIAELFQVILGAGSPKISGAKIARLVEELYMKDAITYQALISIGGIGEAKACQILAALELAMRAFRHE